MAPPSIQGAAVLHWTGSLDKEPQVRRVEIEKLFSAVKQTIKDALEGTYDLTARFERLLALQGPTILPSTCHQQLLLSVGLLNALEEEEEEEDEEEQKARSLSFSFFANDAYFFPSSSPSCLGESSGGGGGEYIETVTHNKRFHCKGILRVNLKARWLYLAVTTEHQPFPPFDYEKDIATFPLSALGKLQCSSLYTTDTTTTTDTTIPPCCAGECGGGVCCGAVFVARGMKGEMIEEGRNVVLTRHLTADAPVYQVQGWPYSLNPRTHIVPFSRIKQPYQLYTKLTYPAIDSLKKICGRYVLRHNLLAVLDERQNTLPIELLEYLEGVVY